MMQNNPVFWLTARQTWLISCTVQFSLLIDTIPIVKTPQRQDDPVEFEQQLARCGAQYELLTTLNAPACHFRFTGPFQGKQVIWDAQLQTLAYYVRNGAIQGQDVRQFIEVEKAGERGIPINIALNLSVIDQPTILKTIIMIRQYKRLAPGRHEFGETVKIPL